MSSREFCEQFMSLGGSTKFAQQHRFGRMGIRSLALLQYGRKAVVETKCRGTPTLVRARIEHPWSLNSGQRRAPARLFAFPAPDGRARAGDGDGGIARALAEVQSRALAEFAGSSGASDSPPSRASRSNGDGRHSLIREVLTDTGVFRDGGGAQTTSSATAGG